MGFLELVVVLIVVVSFLLSAKFIFGKKCSRFG
jgi:hypothetical protein